ncbi:MAG: thioredoxin [Firmicutes bacterium]|mgnify:CR=1 FL=1|nr:thioredoxin [Bacillota bacterium]MBR3705623.1 thioredoxin [Bacillota bacterium]MBR6584067.1 thioredoxin [Bacillota bacterium]
MSALNITKENFQKEIIESEKPVLLDFFATWCGPCQMLSPVIDEIAAERSDIKVAKINVGEQRDLARQYKVMSVPTLMVIRNGEVVNRSLGAMPKHEVLSLLG